MEKADRQFCIKCRQVLNEFKLGEVSVGVCPYKKCPRFGLLTVVSLQVEKKHGQTKTPKKARTA